MKMGVLRPEDRVMALASGALEREEFETILKKEASDLEYSILAYGYAEYLHYAGEPEAARALHGSLLRRDGFWISYAYLAALNDKRRKTR